MELQRVDNAAYVLHDKVKDEFHIVVGDYAGAIAVRKEILKDSGYGSTLSDIDIHTAFIWGSNGDS